MTKESTHFLYLKVCFKKKVVKLRECYKEDMEVFGECISFVWVFK